MRLIAGFFSAGLISLCAVSAAEAGFRCGGALTAAQMDGVATFFSPRHNLGLKNFGSRQADLDSYYKVLTEAQIARLRTPQVAARTTLNQDRAKFLREQLNRNASATAPAWISPAVGVATGSLVGLAAEAIMQLINASGSAGRIQLANLAGKVEPGGVASIVERVTGESDAQLLFSVFYVYTVDVAQKEHSFVMHQCVADVRRE